MEMRPRGGYARLENISAMRMARGALRPRCSSEFRADVIARDTLVIALNIVFLAQSFSLAFSLFLFTSESPRERTSAVLPFDTCARFSFSLR